MEGFCRGFGSLIVGQILWFLLLLWAHIIIGTYYCQISLIWSWCMHVCIMHISWCLNSNHIIDIFDVAEFCDGPTDNYFMASLLMISSGDPPWGSFGQNGGAGGVARPLYASSEYSLQWSLSYLFMTITVLWISIASSPINAGVNLPEGW